MEVRIAVFRLSITERSILTLDFFGWRGEQWEGRSLLVLLVFDTYILHRGNLFTGVLSFLNFFCHLQSVLEFMYFYVEFLLKCFP